MNPLSFVVGQRCLHSDLLGQLLTYCTPVVSNAFLLQFPMNAHQKVIGQHINEQMPFPVGDLSCDTLASCSRVKSPLRAIAS